MTCKNCGNILSQNEQFCPNCGAENPEYKNVKDTNDKSQKKGKFALPKKTLFIFGAIAVVVIIAIILILSRRPSINLDDYVEITASGYEGYGTANYDFDIDQMIEDNTDVFDVSGLDSDDLETMSSSLRVYDDIDDLVSGSLDKSSELSNGDTVTYTWEISKSSQSDFEKRYKCSLKYSNITYKVSGLEKIAEVDPFDEHSFSITYEGEAPNGYLTITNQEYPQIKYEVSKTSELSNGDVITVTASLTDSEDVTGFTLSRTSAEFTVEGLDSYISDISQIPEDYLSQMETQAQDALTSQVADEWENPDWYKSMEYVGSYLLVAKGEPDFFSSTNTLYMIFKITSDSPNGIITYYSYGSFDNIMVYSDGTCYTDLSRCAIPNNFIGAFTVGDYEFTGFETLDMFYNQIIAPELGDYTVTDNISE